MNVQTCLKDFFIKHLDPSRPVLLGLSGGPDSLCLFYMLLALQKEEAFSRLSIHVAHVNHRWRDESDEEARLLKALAEKYALPFHLAILDPLSLKGNLEAACRQKRIKFFTELCLQYNCQGVLLGHHADDQGETILKRILEGGSVMRLAALQETSEIGTLKIWRPFLKTLKKDLIDWLTQQDIHSFDDKTNLDPKFLRGRFRSRIIPALNHEFGKNITEPLCHLSDEITEIQQYFDAKTKPHLERTISTKMGLFLNLQEICPETSFEIKYLLRKLCKLADFSLSQPQIEDAVKMISSGVADRQIKSGKKTLFIDRKRLFIPSQKELILETAVQDDKVMQDSDLESLPMGVDHSQTVKTNPIRSDYSSKDCVNLSSSTAVSRLMQLPKESIPLVPGIYSYGDWTIHVEVVETSFSILNLETVVQDDKVMQDFELESLPMGVDHSQTVKATPIGSDYSSKDCVNLSSSTAASRLNLENSSWIDFWHGHGFAFVNPGIKNLTFSYTTPSALLVGRSKTIAKWWTDHKVPAFLRYDIPVITSGAGVCHEFLTGKSILPKPKSEKVLLIRLRRQRWG